MVTSNGMAWYKMAKNTHAQYWETENTVTLFLWIRFFSIYIYPARIQKKAGLMIKIIYLWKINLLIDRNEYMLMERMVVLI